MPEIRDAYSADQAGIEEIYPAAFPDEDLVPLVRSLSTAPQALSFVAVTDGSVVGHMAMTVCGVESSGSTVALVGPLAVAPGSQRLGYGTALIQAGIQRMEQSGCSLVCLLGDPAYYGRHGFAAEADVLPPYPLPAVWTAAWQSLPLSNPRPKGQLVVPGPWRDRALWSP